MAQAVRSVVGYPMDILANSVYVSQVARGLTCHL